MRYSWKQGWEVIFIYGYAVWGGKPSCVRDTLVNYLQNPHSNGGFWRLK